MATKLSPDRIFQMGFGFWATKTLLSAIEIGLFTELAKGPLDAAGVGERYKFHPRGVPDFLDALVALGMLARKGTKYANTPETALFLDRAKPSYVGGILEMCSHRLYKFWNDLPEGLRTGKPQNEAKSGGNLFEVIYKDPAILRGFLSAMTGLSTGAAMAIAKKFPWKKYKTFVDVGAAQGALPVRVALAHRHLTGAGYDLPVVEPIFTDYVTSFKLENRVTFIPGDFFKDALPGADVIVMGHILHDWNLEEKRMLIETTGGFDYTGADCTGWLKAAGFKRTSVVPLIGPDSMVIGIK